jgi:hypothetical protein
MIMLKNPIAFACLVASLLLLSTIGCHAKSPSVEKCDIHDLQRCKSCTALSNTIDLKNPDAGEYYRGAYWNGLYTAFVLNCQDVGKQLLENHANPNLGGSSGSFPASLVSAWPHNAMKINKQWADMLLTYPVDLSWKNPYSDESATEIIKNEEMPVDYPDIWKELNSNHAALTGEKK